MVTRCCATGRGLGRVADPQGRFVALIGVDLRLGRVIAVGNALGCGPVAAAAAAVLSLPRSPAQNSEPPSTSRSGRVQRFSKDGLLARQRFDAGSYSEPWLSKARTRPTRHL